MITKKDLLRKIQQLEFKTTRMKVKAPAEHSVARIMNATWGNASPYWETAVTQDDLVEIVSSILEHLGLDLDCAEPPPKTDQEQDNVEK